MSLDITNGYFQNLDFSEYQLYIVVCGIVVVISVLIVVLIKYIKKRNETEQWANQTIISRQPTFTSLTGSIAHSRNTLSQRSISLSSNGYIPAESLPFVGSRLDDDDDFGDFNSGVDAFEENILQVKRNDLLFQQSMSHQSVVEDSSFQNIN